MVWNQIGDFIVLDPDWIQEILWIRIRIQSSESIRIHIIELLNYNYQIKFSISPNPSISSFLHSYLSHILSLQTLSLTHSTLETIKKNYYSSLTLSLSLTQNNYKQLNALLQGDYGEGEPGGG